MLRNPEKWDPRRVMFQTEQGGGAVGTVLFVTREARSRGAHRCVLRGKSLEANDISVLLLNCPKLNSFASDSNLAPLRPFAA